jgi:hypothetical protein
MKSRGTEDPVLRAQQNNLLENTHFEVGKEPSMMRLLRAVLVCLRNGGRPSSQAGTEPRLGWKGAPVVEDSDGTLEGFQFDTLFATQLRCAHRPRVQRSPSVGRPIYSSNV